MADLNGGLVSAWSFTRGAPQRASEPLRFTIAIPQGEELPMDAGLPPPLTISRDGNQVACVTRRSSGNGIYLRRREDVDGPTLSRCSRAAADAMGVDAWLTEDHTHVVKIASNRAPDK